MHHHGDFAVWTPFLWVVLIFSFFGLMRLIRHRERLRAIDAARRLAEADKALPPELVEALKERRPRCTPERDLRSGVILLALAVAMIVFATVLNYNGMGPPGHLHPLYGAAAFPALIGLAFLGLWAFNRNRPPS